MLVVQCVCVWAGGGYIISCKDKVFHSSCHILTQLKLQARINSQNVTELACYSGTGRTKIKPPPCDTSGAHTVNQINYEAIKKYASDATTKSLKAQ